MDCHTLDRHIPVLQKEFYPEWRAQYLQQHPQSWARTLWGWVMGQATGAHVAALDRPGPWLQRRQENMACSRLYRLPDEVLMHILDQVDDLPTLDCLLHSCWLFFRLRPRPDGFQTTVWDEHTKQRPSMQKRAWQRAIGKRIEYEGLVKPFSQRKAFILHNDTRYCRACRDCYASGAFAAAVRRYQVTRWCAGCQTGHQALLFSAAQHRAPKEERTCIGREGRMAVCEHVSLPLHEVAAALRAAPASDRTVPLCRSWAHQDWGRGRWSSDTTFLAQPRVSWTGDGGAGDGAALDWCQPAFAVDPAVPVTRAHLRRFLDAQRGGTTAFSRAGFCPHVRPHDHRLLLPFRPDRCACFDAPADDTATDDAARAGWSRSRPSAVPSGESCRQWAASDATRRGCFLLEPWPPARGPDAQHHQQRHSHTFVCPECRAAYTWLRGLGNRVYLRFVFRAPEGPHPLSQPWLRLLQPASWDAAANPDLHRVTWCASPRCATGARWMRVFSEEYMIKDHPDSVAFERQLRAWRLFWVTGKAEGSTRAADEVAEAIEADDARALVAPPRRRRHRTRAWWPRVRWPSWKRMCHILLLSSVCLALITRPSPPASCPARDVVAYPGLDTAPVASLLDPRASRADGNGGPEDSPCSAAAAGWTLTAITDPWTLQRVARGMMAAWCVIVSVLLCVCDGDDVWWAAAYYLVSSLGTTAVAALYFLYASVV